MGRCDMNDPPTEWEEVMSRGLQELKNKSLKANVYIYIYICNLVYSAVVMYNIWRNINDIKHGNQPRTEEKLMQTII